MKLVFCGNFDFETRYKDIDRLFSRYGKVYRIDMKRGYAFIHFEDERDAEDAIHDLHDRPFGHSGRRLTVEWSRQGGPRQRDGSRPTANARPVRTLFVIHFDSSRTRERDIERHFEPYGKLRNVKIRKNFAFVTFETQEEATKALQCTNMSKILDRVVSVEYALEEDNDLGDSPRRGGDYGGKHGDVTYRARSVSPVHRRSYPNPDYGRDHPNPDHARGYGPVYDRHERRPSPYDRKKERLRSPVYDPQPSPYDRKKEMLRSPVYDPHGMPSPYDRKKERPRSPDYVPYPRSPVRRYRH